MTTPISLGFLVGATYLQGVGKTLTTTLALEPAGKLANGVYTIPFTGKHPDSRLVLVSGPFSISNNSLIVPQNYSLGSIAVVRELLSGAENSPQEYTFNIGLIRTLSLNFITGEYA